MVAGVQKVASGRKSVVNDAASSARRLATPKKTCDKKRDKDRAADSKDNESLKEALRASVTNGCEQSRLLLAEIIEREAALATVSDDEFLVFHSFKFKSLLTRSFAI